MAAEPQPKALTRKPLLLNKVEGSQEVVNMAAIVPKEDGVISVSEDRVNTAQKWNLGEEEMQLTKLPALCYTDLLTFSPKTEKRFSSPRITAASAHCAVDGPCLSLRTWGHYFICGL